MKRRVLVTGGARGIGQEIVKFMSERDYQVVAPPRTTLDIGDPTSIDKYFERENEFDILINNAGINNLGALGDITIEHWQQMRPVNLTAPMILIQKVLPHMR